MSPGTASSHDLPALPPGPRRRTVVVPTLDEVDAVASLAALARDVLGDRIADRFVLVDGGSHDDTVASARAAGLDVVVAGQCPPGGPVLGKGDSIWRMADLDTDVVVFRDADVHGVDADDLDRLARGVEADGVALAKGRFRRLQHRDGPPREVSGRITTFVAHPLLGLLAPELTLPEPLSGQFAIRAEVLATLPIVTRYGVDVGLALDVAARFGPQSLASIDLGSLTHRSKEDASLVPMAHDVAATILGRRLAHTDHIDHIDHADHLPRPQRRAMMDPTRDTSEVATVPDPQPGAGRDDGAPGVADDAIADVLASSGPDGPLVVRPPRRAWVATTTTPAGAP